MVATLAIHAAERKVGGMTKTRLCHSHSLPTPSLSLRRQQHSDTAMQKKQPNRPNKGPNEPTPLSQKHAKDEPGERSDSSKRLNWIKPVDVWQGIAERRHHVEKSLSQCRRIRMTFVLRVALPFLLILSPPVSYVLHLHIHMNGCQRRVTSYDWFGAWWRGVILFLWYRWSITPLLRQTSWVRICLFFSLQVFNTLQSTK